MEMVDKKEYYENKLKNSTGNEQEYLIEILFLLNRIEQMKRCENCAKASIDDEFNYTYCTRTETDCTKYSRWEYAGDD